MLILVSVVLYLSFIKNMNQECYLHKGHNKYEKESAKNYYHWN